MKLLIANKVSDGCCDLGEKMCFVRYGWACLWMVEEGGQLFKARLGFIASSRPAWAAGTLCQSK